MHGPWDWKKVWSSAQQDDSEPTPKTNPMHGDRLMATGAQMGIAIIGCPVGGIVCAAHVVATTRNARHATPSPRRAIVDME